MASASKTTAPRSRRNRPTVDLPEARPPVSPTRSTRAFHHFRGCGPERLPAGPLEELAAGDRDRLADELHPPALCHADADRAAAGRGLVAGELRPPEPPGPVGCQGAVRGARDRVLV